MPMQVLTLTFIAWLDYAAVFRDFAVHYLTLLLDLAGACNPACPACNPVCLACNPT